MPCSEIGRIIGVSYWVLNRQNSLSISLLAGKLPQRMVRDGLRPQGSRTCRDSDACIIDGHTSYCVPCRATNFHCPSTGRKKSVVDNGHFRSLWRPKIRSTAVNGQKIHLTFIQVMLKSVPCAPFRSISHDRSRTPNPRQIRESRTPP